MSKVWFEQKERGSPFAIRIIFWVSRRLGRLPARLLLYPITLYFLLFAGRARRASRNYLGRLFGRPASLLQIARHIHTFAATILDRVFFLTGRFELFELRMHGVEQVMSYVEQGRGCLLLGSHFGSFEVLRALAVKQEKARVRVLMYPAHNEFLTNLLDTLSPDIADTVIPLGGPESLLKVKESIDEGYMVGLLGDRVAESDKVVQCRFFDEQVAFPAGPVLLAATLKVPLVMVSGVYRGGNRYDLSFELLSERLEIPRNEREILLREWMQRYADHLEAQVRQAPYNWFNFYDFWHDEK